MPETVVFSCSDREKFIGMSAISGVIIFFLTRCGGRVNAIQAACTAIIMVMCTILGAPLSGVVHLHQCAMLAALALIQSLGSVLVLGAWAAVCDLATWRACSY